MLSHPIAQKTINSVQNDWDRLPRYIHDALVFILELLPLGFLASQAQAFFPQEQTGGCCHADYHEDLIGERTH